MTDENDTAAGHDRLIYRTRPSTPEDHAAFGTCVMDIIREADPDAWQNAFGVVESVNAYMLASRVLRSFTASQAVQRPTEFGEVADLDLTEAIKAHATLDIGAHIQTMQTADIVALLVGMQTELQQNAELSAGREQGWTEEVATMQKQIIDQGDRLTKARETMAERNSELAAMTKHRDHLQASHDRVRDELMSLTVRNARLEGYIDRFKDAEDAKPSPRKKTKMERKLAELRAIERAAHPRREIYAPDGIMALEKYGASEGPRPWYRREQ